jgi:IS5 family transposase
MIEKLQANEREFFRTRLEDLINPKHELALLAKSIDWQYIENELSKYYSDKGAPSIPIRTMVGIK